MSPTDVSNRTAPTAVGLTAVGPTASRAGATAALAGLVASAGMLATADLVNPQWSNVERMVSHYIHAPRAGWLITVGLVVLAAASAALLRVAALRTRGGRFGLWMLGVWTAAVLVGGIFPTDPYGQWDQPPTTAGMVHGVAGLIAFGTLPVAAVVLTRVWRRDPRWHRVTSPLTVATVAAVTALLAFVVIGGDVMTDGPSLSFGPYQSLAGLAERVMLGAYLVWLAIAAAGLRRFTTD
jgi:Protein of unknown function (DUF998)